MPNARDLRDRTAAFVSLCLTGVSSAMANARSSILRRRDLLGLLLMVLSALAFSLMAAFTKLFLPATPAQAVVFSRGVLMSAAFILYARSRRAPILGRRRHVLLLRGLLGYAAVSCYFYSVQHLPLGDAVLLQYSHPVFVAILAPLFLGEATTRRHWWLVLAALLGVALIVGPEGKLRSDALVGLLGSLSSGLAYMTVRSLSRSENPVSILIWFTAVTIPGSLISVILLGRAALPGNAREVVGHLAVAASGLVGQIAMTLGLSRAGAARATAASMAGPVFGLLLGWGFFSQTPVSASIAGTALVSFALLLLAADRPPGELQEIGRK
jgi:drug/metabolite transporter (DMT)-like permease